MAKYAAQWRYSSSLGGPFSQGDQVELEQDVAEAINRDSPGVLVLIALEGHERAPLEAPQDRMQKPRARRDRGEGGPITRAEFKATKKG